MRLRLVVVMAGMLSLFGCDAVTDVKLAMARQELRQECFGNFTNTCVSKTIDFNIEVLESVPLIGPEDKKGLIALFGDKGWGLYEEAEEEVKDKVIEVLKSKRPGLFSRWFLGDAQPFDGKGVIEFTPSDLQEIRAQVERVYIDKVKAAGLKPNKEEAAKYSVDSKEASNPSSSLPLPNPVVSAQPNRQESSRPGFASYSYTLDGAIQTLIKQETSVDGGSEYQDGRRIVQVDLNGDGEEDAIVLISIEGKGGSNSSYQTLAAFYHGSEGWSLQEKMIVSGAATEVQVESQNVVTLKVLNFSENDPMCCPSVISYVKYLWTGKGFTEQPG